MRDILIIAGPSCGGKTTVADEILKVDARFTYLRSATTRPMRNDEHDSEYIYYTEEEFLCAVDDGVFAEYMVYGGNMYGTRNEELRRAHEEGKIPLLVLDLSGVESLGRHPDYSTCTVYLYSDLAVVDERLDQRNDSPDSIERRKKQNRQDYSTVEKYSDFIYAFLPNDSSIQECRDATLAAFADYLSGERQPTELRARAISYMQENCREN